MKESLADLQEVDSSTVQCRVDQDELTPAVTGEPRSNRHYRLNGCGNLSFYYVYLSGGKVTQVLLVYFLNIAVDVALLRYIEPYAVFR